MSLFEWLVILLSVIGLILQVIDICSHKLKDE